MYIYRGCQKNVYTFYIDVSSNVYIFFLVFSVYEINSLREAQLVTMNVRALYTMDSAHRGPWCARRSGMVCGGFICTVYQQISKLK